MFSNNKAIKLLDPLTLGFALEIKQDSGEIKETTISSK
jgi:hypothetical protein